MDTKSAVLLLFLLVGYWLVQSGLGYEVDSVPRSNEYFTRDEPIGDRE